MGAVQPQITKFLNLSVEPTPGFKVIVGNFETMNVEGYILSLDVSLLGHKVQIQMYMCFTWQEEI